MSYEEFVEGLRPDIDERSKELSYAMKPVIFREICLTPKQSPLCELWVRDIDPKRRGATVPTVVAL